MSTPNIQRIRTIIAEAKASDSDNQALTDFTRGKLATLHRMIKLPPERPGSALAQFITRYIEHVPDFIEAMTALLIDAKMYEQGSVFLSIAEDFFISPPELANEHSGLAALLDEAYLSHRLMEEINDRVQIACGSPLSPMDMNLSNIIVHGLLGDEYANQLDLAVHYAIETLFDSSELLSNPSCTAYLSEQKDNQWSKVLEKWPCLAGDSSISLDIGSWIGLPLSHSLS